MEIICLRHIATVMNSNVDKVIAADEAPVRLCNYVHVYKNDFITTEMEFDKGSATEAEIKRFGLRIGDVIITKDSEDRHDIGVPAYVRNTADDLVCGYHLTILRAFKKKCRGDFLFWALQSKGVQEAFAVAASGITRYGLGQEGIKGLSLHLPDLATQKQIADFLDTETARIDALIEKKQRLVAVANERIAALVETAVSSGGRQIKLGHHIDVLSGYAFASDGFSSNPEDMRLLRGANVTPDSIRWDDVVYWPRDDVARLSRFALSVGDIVLGMDRPWVSDGIRVAELREWDIPALLLQRVCKISARASINAGYLKLLLTSRRFLAYFEPIMTGVSVPHISPNQVRNFRFNYVPLEDQVRISTQIELAREQVSKIVGLAEASITCLREYRAALITDAVTGQIDVAESAQPVAAKLPLRADAEIVPLHTTPQPLTQPDRRTVRVLVAAEVVHRLGAQPSLGRIKLQKLMYLAQAHANINDIDGSYERYRAGPYDGAMMPEIETGLRQAQFYAATEDSFRPFRMKEPMSSLVRLSPDGEDKLRKP